MKKQFVVACSLLLFSTTATFAQMEHIVPKSQLAGDKDSPPPKIPDNSTFDNSFKLVVNQTIGAGSPTHGGGAILTLKNNELVMEIAVTEMMGDEFTTNTKPVWSIPFSGSAKELEFQPDGDLVVRDANNKVLWAANVSASRGKRLAINRNGKLLIFDSTRRQLLWEK